MSESLMVNTTLTVLHLHGEELYMQKHCQLALKKTEAIENETKALDLHISTIRKQAEKTT